MTLANDLISALTATFRADAQDLLTTVKDLTHAFDAADTDEDCHTQDAVYHAIAAIRLEVRERISHEDDEIALDPTFERDLLLRDVTACIKEFFN